MNYLMFHHPDINAIDTLLSSVADGLMLINHGYSRQKITSGKFSQIILQSSINESEKLKDYTKSFLNRLEEKLMLIDE